MPNRRSAQPSGSGDRPNPATSGDSANPDSADPVTAAKPAKAARSARPPLPSTSRRYGKVTGGKTGKPPVPKAFSHRKRG